MIGRVKVRTRVVEATFDKKAAMTKFKSMMAIKTIRGFGEMWLMMKAETRSVISSFARAALIVRDPKKTKMIGSVKRAAS